MTRTTAPEDGTEAAARVADVLIAVGEHGGPVGVTELSQRLGLGKSVVHRILRTLEDRTLVCVVPGTAGRYVIGSGPAGWGSRTSPDRRLLGAAAPQLWSLLERTRCTVTLSVLSGTERRHVAQLAVGGLLAPSDRMPLHAGAAGRAILAFAPQRVYERVLRGPLPALTTSTVTDAIGLERQLVRVRTAGVAISVGEAVPGVAAVAAPLFRAGEVVGAVGVCLPAERLTTHRSAELTGVVRASGQRVSAAAERHT